MLTNTPTYKLQFNAWQSDIFKTFFPLLHSVVEDIFQQYCLAYMQQYIHSITKGSTQRRNFRYESIETVVIGKQLISESPHIMYIPGKSLHWVETRCIPFTFNQNSNCECRYTRKR